MFKAAIVRAAAGLAGAMTEASSTARPASAAAHALTPLLAACRTITTSASHLAPPTSWNEFTKAEYDKTKKEVEERRKNGEVTNDVMKELSGKWRQLSKEDKQVYADRAKVNADLDPETQRKKKEKEFKNALTLTGYRLFISEYMASNKTTDGSNALIKAAAVWKSLAQATKESFNQRANAIRSKALQKVYNAFAADYYANQVRMSQAAGYGL